MATEKWNTAPAWVAAYTSAATFDSIVSGNAIMSDLQIDNTSNLDIFYDFAIILGSAAFVAPNFIGVYYYPLSQDGTTYADGRFAASAAGPPCSTNYERNIEIVAATQAQTGVFLRGALPPGKGKFVIWNKGGVTLAGSGANKIYIRTYDRAIA